MPLTLTLHEPPTVPLEVEGLSPERLAARRRGEIEALTVWHGNRRAQLADFFTVSGNGDDELRIEGDLRRVKFLGADMRGGELVVEGGVGDFSGVGMRSGRLVVKGSAGHHLGGAYPGERAGMRGGEILVHGDAGDQVGAGLRRGLIAVAGRLGDAAGLRMLAGTIVAVAGLGASPGAAMRRGTIVAMSQVTPLPTFAFACSYRPPFLRLYLRRLRELGLPLTDEQIEGSYARWSGDGLELRRGEILILEAGQ
jgi:formylmethanofuran dehydrogenase subunit C